MQIEIELNGAAYKIESGATVQDLVARLELSHQAIAVAVNRQIISRPKWHEVQLLAAQKVDVVRAIGGG